MARQSDRFVKIYSQGSFTTLQIWVDRETGVNYLWQICPAFTLLWIPVALMAMGLYRWLDWRLDRMLGV